MAAQFNLIPEAISPAYARDIASGIGFGEASKLT